MTFRDYLIVMAITTVAAWAAWIVVLVSIDPMRSGSFGFLVFYTTLALSLLGTLSIAGAGIRVWMHREELISRHVSRAFRHAVLFTLLLITSLILLPSGLLRWWTMSLLILTLSLVELSFLSSQRNRSS